MTNTQDAFRKAAVLISSLDSASADALLEQMGEDEAKRVRNAVMELERISPDEQRRVIEDFMRVGPLVPAAETSGIEIDESLAKRLANSEPTAEPPFVPNTNAKSAPFRFLHEAAGETLAQFLQFEHPQTIAVVVSHLPSERAADVVTRLDSALQADVLRRIAELDATDPNIIEEIEREMESLLADQLHASRRLAVGTAAVEAILRAADTSDRKDLLANLSKHDRGLLEQLQHESKTASTSGPPSPSAGEQTFDKTPRDEEVSKTTKVSFKQIEELDDASLAVVFRAADPSILLLALTGASQRLVGRLLSQLPPRDAKRLRRKMEQPGPLRLDDIEKAQSQVAALAERLAAEGQIQLPTSRQFVMAA